MSHLSTIWKLISCWIRIIGHTISQVISTSQDNFNISWYSIYDEKTSCVCIFMYTTKSHDLGPELHKIYWEIVIIKFLGMSLTSDFVLLIYWHNHVNISIHIAICYAVNVFNQQIININFSCPIFLWQSKQNSLMGITKTRTHQR
jgi:hypothetical protein